MDYFLILAVCLRSLNPHYNYIPANLLKFKDYLL